MWRCWWPSWLRLPRQRVCAGWLRFLPRRVSAVGSAGYHRGLPCGKSACRHGNSPRPLRAAFCGIFALWILFAFCSPILAPCFKDLRPSEAWSSAARGAVKTSLPRWKHCLRSRSLRNVCCAANIGDTCPLRCSRAEYPTSFLRSRCARQTAVYADDPQIQGRAKV